MCGIGQAIATTVEVSHGLGKYQHTLDGGQVALVLKVCSDQDPGCSTADTVLQAQYAGDILYLPTLVSAEIGTLQLIRWLAADEIHQMMARYMVYFTLAWSIPSTIIVAFHGGPAHPWSMQSTHPIDLVGFVVPVHTIHGLIELSISFGSSSRPSLSSPKPSLWRSHYSSSYLCS